MAIPGNMLTTAMAVMPHTEVERAMAMALSLDIPFWPQFSFLIYYEDMYVQASEHFLGVELDLLNRKLRSSQEKFVSELDGALTHLEESEFLDISETYSAVYQRFLSLDLSQRPAIHGQMEGPITVGFNIADEGVHGQEGHGPVAAAKRPQSQRLHLHRRAWPSVRLQRHVWYGDRAASQGIEHSFSMVERP